MIRSLARCIALAGFVSAIGAVLAGCSTPILSDEDSQVVEVSAPNCSPEIFDSMGPLDVALAIDTSQSTIDPSGVDVDEDGIVGAVFESFYTDIDDSSLAAIVKSVALLLESSVGHDIRFSLITFSGRMIPTQEPPRRVVMKRDAVIRIPLTGDTAELAVGLDAVLRRGSKGMSNYFAGMRRATRSLLETRDRERVSRRLVLFISDSPTPLLRRVGDVNVFNMRDTRLESSAREAVRERVVFNTFGLSEDSMSWRRLPIGLIASATGGTYHAVEDASQLYCHLISSLTRGASVN
jgi:hypothetical protein